MFEAVLHPLGAESFDFVLRELGVTTCALSDWPEEFIAGRWDTLTPAATLPQKTEMPKEGISSLTSEPFLRL
jgi:hypothetical protein